MDKEQFAGGGFVEQLGGVGLGYVGRHTAGQFGQFGEGVGRRVVVVLVGDAVAVVVAQGSVGIVRVAAVGYAVAVEVGDARPGQRGHVVEQYFATDIVVTEARLPHEQVGADLVFGLFVEVGDLQFRPGEVVVELPVRSGRQGGFDGDEVAQVVVSQGRAVEVQRHKLRAHTRDRHRLRVVAIAVKRQGLDLEGARFGTGLGIIHITAVAQLGHVHLVDAAGVQVIDIQVGCVVDEFFLPLGLCGGHELSGGYALEPVAHEQAAVGGVQGPGWREGDIEAFVGDAADDDEGGVEAAVGQDIGARFAADAHPIAATGCIAGRQRGAYAAQVEAVGSAGVESGKSVGVAGADADRIAGGHDAFSGDVDLECCGAGRGGVPVYHNGVGRCGFDGESGG